jgi:hypothetical protein
MAIDVSIVAAMRLYLSEFNSSFRTLGARFYSLPNQFQTRLPSKTKQIFEQMFHTPPQFPAKLIVHTYSRPFLCAFVLRFSLIPFFFSAFSVSVRSLPVGRWFNFSHLAKSVIFAQMLKSGTKFPILIFNLFNNFNDSRGKRPHNLLLSFTRYSELSTRNYFFAITSLVCCNTPSSEHFYAVNSRGYCTHQSWNCRRFSEKSLSQQRFRQEIC